jgi:hypothetical protein
MRPSLAGAVLAVAVALPPSACTRPGQGSGQPPKAAPAPGDLTLTPRLDEADGLVFDDSKIVPCPGVPLGGARPDLADAPAYATTGHRKAAEVEPGCVARSIALPAGLTAGGAVQVVKFAVDASGRPSRFEVLSPVSDERVGAAIWKAVETCRWKPGADPRGLPLTLWVILPLRFEAREEHDRRAAPAGPPGR